MKILSYCFFILTVVFLIDCLREQASGHVEVHYPGRRVGGSIADRSRDPDLYRDLMNYQWVRIGLSGLLGVVFLSMKRRQDRLDPMSPSFQGAEEIEKLGAYLDKKKSEK